MIPRISKIYLCYLALLIIQIHGQEMVTEYPGTNTYTNTETAESATEAVTESFESNTEAGIESSTSSNSTTNSQTGGVISNNDTNEFTNGDDSIKNTTVNYTIEVTTSLTTEPNDSLETTSAGENSQMMTTETVEAYTTGSSFNDEPSLLETTTDSSSSNELSQTTGTPEATSEPIRTTTPITTTSHIPVSNVLPEDIETTTTSHIPSLSETTIDSSSSNEPSQTTGTPEATSEPIRTTTTSHIPISNALPEAFETTTTPPSSTELNSGEVSTNSPSQTTEATSSTTPTSPSPTVLPLTGNVTSGSTDSTTVVATPFNDLETGDNQKNVSSNSTNQSSSTASSIENTPVPENDPSTTETQSTSHLMSESESTLLSRSDTSEPNDLLTEENFSTDSFIMETDSMEVQAHKEVVTVAVNNWLPMLTFTIINLSCVIAIGVFVYYCTARRGKWYTHTATAGAFDDVTVNHGAAGYHLASDADCKAQEMSAKSFPIQAKDGWCVPLRKESYKKTADSGV